MGRTKGTPKTGGRKAGTPNKTTQTTREFVQSILDANQEQLRDDLKKLAPKDRVNALLGLLPYIIPKQQATTATLAVERLTEDEISDMAGLILNSIDKDEDTINEE